MRRIEELERRRLMSIVVTGTVYNDVNANGAQDAGEPGLSGFVVYNDANNNRVRDAGEALATSDASGKYVLTGFGWGTSPSHIQYIRQDTPAGWQVTQPGPITSPGTTNNGAYWIRPYFTIRGSWVFMNRNFGNHYVAGPAAPLAAPTRPAAAPLTALGASTHLGEHFFADRPIL